MPDIVHDFPIKASRQKVFEAVSSPDGLDSWWTKRSFGHPEEGNEYVLWFGPQDNWRAVVTRSAPDVEFELQITQAHHDWQGTRVGFLLEETGGLTQVRFHHIDWPQANDHYRGSSFCWAMYLRLLRRYIENHEVVPYEIRLKV